MFDFLSKLFDTSDFPARWDCGNWTAGHGWLHILSDLGVWSAYVAIPCVLGFFVLRRRDIPFRTIFVLFGAFILACGTTHLMEAIIFWWPAYRLAGLIKLFTALVSWATIFALIRVSPKMLAMHSPDELVREIAVRREAEKRAESKHREVFQLVHQIGKIGHWEWNSLTDENRWSPEIEALYGLPPGGFKGGYEGWAKLIHPDDLPQAEADVRQALQTGHYFTEFRVIWPDGSVHWLETRAKVFKDSHDKPVRIMGVNMDITERKRQEESLRASEQRWRTLAEALREADRRKNEFLATLAHELRNPLAPLRNAVELLRRANGDATLIEKARSMIGRQLDQMVRLIDDLLDMARISQGKVRLRKERVELKTVVRSALEAVQPFIQAQGHELTIALPSEAVYLDADATRLAQVLSNLLNNAAKYTERGGHICLTAVRQGDEVVLSVRDTGIGIAAEHLPHLFEMFSQIVPALERSQGGLGIGLALVRGLVELHGGRVEAHSDGIGQGSEFIVRLPIVDGPAQIESQPARDENPEAAGRKQRILVVDDSRDAADSLAMMLRISGHETRTAYDGSEAVQTAAAFRPEIALLDIGMPKMNGYEAARHIRQESWGEGMVLIALTGWGQEEDKRRAFEAGFDHHLTKPVEAATLEKLLAEINPNQRLAQQT